MFKALVHKDKPDIYGLLETRNGEWEIIPCTTPHLWNPSITWDTLCIYFNGEEKLKDYKLVEIQIMTRDV